MNERDIKNSVKPGFGPGKNIPYSLHTSEEYAYRVTGMDQIEDIINCGYVRPKGYGIRREKVGDKLYWSRGNSSLYYHDKRPVIQISMENIQDGQIGPISINNLEAIWIFNEEENKYEDKLVGIKELHKDKMLNEMLDEDKTNERSITK